MKVKREIAITYTVIAAVISGASIIVTLVAYN